MAITAGQNGLASDFINQAQKNATPSSDSGRVPKLEGDGKLASFFTKNGQVLAAGATINGATLPVPVYQDKTDNEVYACDGNDTSKLKFIGFATSNGTNGNPITVQFSGVVGGFSGLDEGQKYYLSDTAGAISNSPGTYEVLVGVAISTTELFIQKGSRYASGTVSFSSTTTTTITVGFRPSLIRISALLSNNSDQIAVSNGGWTVFGGNTCAEAAVGNSNFESQVASTAWRVTTSTGSNNRHTGVIDNITDTSFRLNNTKSGSVDNVQIYWEAIGEL